MSRAESDMCAVWSRLVGDVELGDDEVHVWRAALSGAALFEHCRETLSTDERARAARFHFRRDEERYVIARGILRALLGRYLRRPARQISFRYTNYGKPLLDGLHADAGLDFNVSHSHELALYAFTKGRAVGVDVEHLRDDFAGDEIAARFFSRSEVAALGRLPPESKTEAFFNCWTRKEAYIKALGEGLSRPLDLFSVSLDPDAPAALLCVEREPNEAARWTLCHLAPGPGYVGALAVRDRGWRLRCWDYQEGAGRAEALSPAPDPCI